jgi:hypothetical protein
MAIINKNPRLEEYELLHDAYYGSGMFASGMAITEHDRESTQSIAFRRNIAYYLNYTGPILNASVDPIFKDEIKREYGKSVLFDEFINDVDRQGTSLQEFIEQNAIAAKLYGVMYIVADNVSEFGSSLAETLANRSMPYLTAVEPKNVVNYEFDDNGKLKLFTYATYLKNADGTIKAHYHTWTPKEWEITDSDNKVIGQGEHNIGRIPVVQWFGRAARKRDILPPPEYLSIAKTNANVYNLCSLLSQILYNQTFSILTMPVDNNGLQDITIGTDNLLAYPFESSNAPNFIAPDTGPAEVLMAQIDKLINEMYRMSGIDSVIGVQQAKSGVAKQWDFERTNQNLAAFAVRCENAEYDIIALYKLWSGDNLEYFCEYPKDFKVNDVTESLTQAQQAKDLEFESDTFDNEILKKVIDAYMPNLEKETKDAIVKEAQTAADTKAQDKTYNDDDLNGGDNDTDEPNA